MGLRGLGLLTLFFSALTPALGQFEWTQEAPPCPDGTFFDTSGLQCTDCQANSVVDASGLGCTCAAGFFADFSNADNVLRFSACTRCTAGVVSSFDGLHCAMCDTTSVAGSHAPAALVGTACQCQLTTGQRGVIAERNAQGALFRDASGAFLHRCILCSGDAAPDAATGTCLACPYPQVANSTTGAGCACPTGLSATERCIQDSGSLARIAGLLRVSLEKAYRAQATLPGATVDDAPTLVTVSQSAPLVEMLESSVEGCYYSGNRTACNALANLCVLQLYSGDSPACQMFTQLRLSRDSRQYRRDVMQPGIEWADTLPWLQYPQASAPVYLNSGQVQSQLRFAGGSLELNSVSELTFVVAKYSLDGTFLGYEDFTSQMQVCEGGLQDVQVWKRVGTYYKNQCTVKIMDVLRSTRTEAGPVFYDLYYVDGLDGAESILYPVPVTILNMDSSAGQVLTRRFFEVDAVSGRGVDDTAPQFVVYPESIELRVEMSEDDRTRMKPPVLVIQYSAVGGENLAEAEITSEFRSRYQNSQASTKSFWKGWDICMGVLIPAATLVTMARLYEWSRRRSSVIAMHGESLAVRVALAEAAYCIGLAMSATAVILGMHALVIFKGQASAFLFLFPNTEIQKFQLTVMAGAACLFLATLHMIYTQTLATDFAMVDWEQGKMVLGSAGNELSAPVSCWRSVFIANEFNELSVARRTSPALTFFTLVFILEGLGWKRIALMHPGGMEPDNPNLVDYSRLLGFGISVSLYLAIVISQLAVRAIGTNIRLPVIGNLEDPCDSFMDLLYFSNVSLFIFDEAAAGFLLDGQIKFPTADTTLAKLQAHMDDVRTGSTAARGLTGNNDSAFMLFAGKDLQNGYMRDKEALQRRRANGRYNRAEYVAKVEELDAALKRIARSNHEAPKVQEPGYYARWTRSASIRDAGDMSGKKTVLAYDKHCMWSSTMFYGQELRLSAFDMMLFGALDMFLQNAAMSASITWGVGSLLAWARVQIGSHNLSKGTFVDEAFLN